MILEFGEDRELAGRRRHSVGAVEDHRGADFLARAEDRDELRTEVDAHPGRSRRHAFVVPAIVAVAHGRADIEDGGDRAVDQARRIGLAERLWCYRDPSRGRRGLDRYRHWSDGI